MCLESLLWLLGRCCTWMLDPPQKDEDRVRGQEGPLTSDSRSSRLPRESVLIAACGEWMQGSAQGLPFQHGLSFILSVRLGVLDPQEAAGPSY